MQPKPKPKSDPEPTTQNVLQQAIQAVPAVRYALGIAGVVAALAIASTLSGGSRTAIIGAVVMILLMVFLVIFARVSKLGAKPLQTPAVVLTWFVLALVIVLSFFTVSSLFFKWPLPFDELTNTILSTSTTISPEEYSYPNQQITFGQLPEAMRTPIEQGLSEKALQQELAKKGSLTLDGSTLVLGSKGGMTATSLFVYTLSLYNGGRIITNGNSFKLIAAQVKVSNGSIISFPEDDRTVPPSEPSIAGINSLSSSDVILASLNPIAGLLKVDLSGQNGGQGGQGLSGTQGNKGPRGSDGSDSLFDCKRSGRDGGPGEPGGNGLTGASGGNGGNSGNLLLLGGAAKTTDAQIIFVGSGGSPGLGGEGGPGGPGGPGGDGGSGSTYCGGGHTGPSGPSGPSGEKGIDGQPGQPGQLIREETLTY
jgi:hypothetical protein